MGSLGFQKVAKIDGDGISICQGGIRLDVFVIVIYGGALRLLVSGTSMCDRQLCVDDRGMCGSDKLV